MKSYFEDRKKNCYFEGWYFKLQGPMETVAFIPSFHRSNNGDSFAMIQMITETFSHAFYFPSAMFMAKKEELYIQIGSNIFSKNGMRLSLCDSQYAVHGNVEFSQFTQLSGDIMGPFGHIPFMQCSHGVLSVKHCLSGYISINGICISLNNGTGYIEKDLGTSFPDTYLWTQYNRPDLGIMISAATIPFVGAKFNGCIGYIYRDGKEYRIATYKGARVKLLSPNEVMIKQKQYTLRAYAPNLDGQKLHAPENGQMTRSITESLSCQVNYQLYKKDRLILDVRANNASFEYAQTKKAPLN